MRADNEWALTAGHATRQFGVNPDRPETEASLPSL